MVISCKARALRFWHETLIHCRHAETGMGCGIVELQTRIPGIRYRLNLLSAQPECVDLITVIESECR